MMKIIHNHCLISGRSFQAELNVQLLIMNP